MGKNHSGRKIGERNRWWLHSMRHIIVVDRSGKNSKHEWSWQSSSSATTPSRLTEYEFPYDRKISIDPIAQPSRTTPIRISLRVNSMSNFGSCLRYTSNDSRTVHDRLATYRGEPIPTRRSISPGIDPAPHKRPLNAIILKYFFSAKR